MFNIFVYIKKILIIFNKNFFDLCPLILLFFSSTLVDLLSIAIIAPYISFIQNSQSNDVETNLLILFYKKFDFVNIYIFLCIILFIVFFLKFIFALGIRFAIKNFTLKCRRFLQIRLFDSYQSMSYSEFSSRGSSEFIKNVRELSGDCVGTLDASLRIFSELILLFIICFYLLWLQPLIVLTLISIILFVFYFHNFFLKPKTIFYGKNRTKALNYIYQAIDEGLKGFKEIKILGKESYFKKIQEFGLNKTYINELKSELILFYPRYLYELIIITFITIFITFNLNLGLKSSEIIPIVATFAFASLRIIPSVSIISSGLIMIQYTHFAVDIIYRDIISLIQKKIHKVTNIENINSIELKNVNFKYPNSENYIFYNLNFRINKYDCIGILGKNGSGKSTFVDILLGILIFENGKIFVNEEETKDKNFIRKNIGYLPQDHLIVTGSIKKNITLEIDKKKIDNTKLLNSIKSVNLNKFIKKLPRGINTFIGNDGYRLSGGEYKKIALARLFYHDKDILIMDEATNSLDKESEQLIINEINRIKKKKTIIIISHKIKDLKGCDKLFIIKNKKIEHLKKSFI